MCAFHTQLGLRPHEFPMRHCLSLTFLRPICYGILAVFPQDTRLITLSSLVERIVRIELTSPAWKAGVIAIIRHPHGAGDQVRTGDPNLGKVVLYRLSYSRICDYSLGSFVTINVNGVIKPTNITGIGFHNKPLPKTPVFNTQN